MDMEDKERRGMMMMMMRGTVLLWDSMDGEKEFELNVFPILK